MTLLDVLTVVWTAIALAGIVISIRLIEYAVADEGARKALQVNGARQIVTDYSLRSEIVRLLVHALAAVVGMATLAEIRIGIALPMALVAIQGLVLVNTTLTLYFREQLLSAERARLEDEGGS